MNSQQDPDPQELVIATHNLGKFREIAAILSAGPWKLLSLDAFPELPEVIEDGATFWENAAKKAQTISRLTGRLTLADDSGLAVEALQGRPGVFSSRYGRNDGERCARLLAEMESIPEGKRQAAFICVIAIASPGGKTQAVEGACHGQIAWQPRGRGGFGYDPIFFLPELGKTMAELEPEMKNRLSHRARALEKLRLILPQFM